MEMVFLKNKEINQNQSDLNQVRGEMIKSRNFLAKTSIPGI